VKKFQGRPNLLIFRAADKTKTPHISKLAGFNDEFEDTTPSTMNSTANASFVTMHVPRKCNPRARRKFFALFRNRGLICSPVVAAVPKPDPKGAKT